MKNLRKNKSGISLIVLVITIIVMIILAAAIVLSLSNSGIIGKANKAKTDTDIASAKDIVAMAHADWMLDEAKIKENDNTITSFGQYAENKLKEAGYDENQYAVTDDGIVAVGNAAVTAVKNNLQIGTIIDGYNVYLENKATEEKNYTTDGRESSDSILSSNWNPRTIGMYTDFVWRYAGINEEGRILLLPDTKGQNSKYDLFIGCRGGTRYGIQVIEEACKTLYSTTIGNARSINMEDIINILEYKGEKGGYLNSSGQQINTKEELTIGDIAKIEGKESMSRTSTPDGTITWEKFSKIKANGFEIKSTRDDIKNKEIIFGNTYWIATENILPDMKNNCTWFGIRRGSSSGISNTNLYYQYAMGTYLTAIRPIVEISTEATLNELNGIWTIK